ncbi:MAG: transposase [Lentisphaerae bacterium]|nr:transposase [Lentisphaerota bacterium]
MRTQKKRCIVENLILEAQPGICPICGEPLSVIRHRERFTETFQGVLFVLSKDRGCTNKECECYHVYHRPTEEDRLALKGREFGLDIVIFIGENYIQNNMSVPKIHKELTGRHGISVSEKTVGNLLKVYLAMCYCADAESDELSEKLKKQGRVILSADGVQFGKTSPVLYVIRDVISGEIFYSQRMALRGKDDFVPVLQKVKKQIEELGIEVEGIITDKEKGLVPAIREVFPDTPYQWCQYHCLEKLDAPLEDDLKKLSDAVSQTVRDVKELRKKLLRQQERIRRNPGKGYPDIEEVELALELCEAALTAAGCSGKAPLDPAVLKRCDRLLEIRKALRKMLRKPGGPWKELRKLYNILKYPDSVKRLADRLLSCISIIRKIARILNMESDSDTVRQALESFLKEQQKKQQSGRRGRKSFMKIFVDHVVAVTERYSGGLFHCYDIPNLPAHNNKLEREFGSIKRGQRKVTGRKSTSGGVIESAGEFFVKARSLSNSIPDLAERIRNVSCESYRAAMQKLLELLKPAGSAVFSAHRKNISAILPAAG